MSELTRYESVKLILQRVEQSPGWYGGIPDTEVLARAQVYATLALVDALAKLGPAEGGADE